MLKSSQNDDRLQPDDVVSRLDRIETLLGKLLDDKESNQEFYTTGEVAAILGKAKFTVREWCRNGRIKATKRECGRGNSEEWSISREEIQRIRDEGLLPVERFGRG